MEEIEFTLEKLPFVMEVPEDYKKQVDNYLELAEEMPLNVTINGKNFVLMQEEDFEELLAGDEEYDEGYDLYEFDCEEEEEETSNQSLELQEKTVQLIISLLDEVQMNMLHINLIHDVVESHQTLVRVRRVFGGEEV